jgi:protein tyrosine phosphatase (PTP) superfamily phosphohydrolase (DUF442 family)
MTAAILESIHNHRPIDEWLGSSGQPTVAQLAAIADAGYTTVINLALHDDPRYSLPDEAGTVRGLGMGYVHIPVPFDSPTRDDLLAFFEAMDRHRGDKVWVHCAANIRVSVFLGLYWTLREERDEADAFALMQTLWQPNPVWARFIAERLAEGRQDGRKG